MRETGIVGSCHCGAVSFTYFGQQDRLVSCNCSICRRLRTLWAHDSPSKVEITNLEDGTLKYSWGDKELVFHSCKTCGCTVAWTPALSDSVDRMAVNLALADPQHIAHIAVRHFDGADTWQFLD